MYGTLLAEKLTNVQVQLTVKGKTTPDSYNPTPKSRCAQNVPEMKCFVGAKPLHDRRYGVAKNGRKLTIPERWQAVGMHNGGFSHRRVADHFRVNHSIIVRLMQRFCQNGECY
jgi:hypothetical protein